MTRFEYIDALRQALTGLPDDVIAKTVAEYEKRIFDASASGYSEDEIMNRLNSPQKVADDVRAAQAPKLPAVIEVPPTPLPSGAPAAAASRGPVSAVRMFFSLVGLMIFNLFMIGPTIAYLSLLFAAFVVSLACYGGGIIMTAGSMAGVNQLAWNEPMHRFHMHNSHEDGPVTISAQDGDDHTVIRVGDKGVHIEAEARPHIILAGAQLAPSAPAAPGAPTAPAAPAAPAAKGAAGTKPAASASAVGPATPATDRTVIDIGPAGVRIEDHNGNVSRDSWDREESDDENVNIDIPGLHIHNGDFDSEEHVISLTPDFFNISPSAMIGLGISLIFAGILGFLLCLVVTKYSVIGLVRLAQMEFAVLRGA